MMVTGFILGVISTIVVLIVGFVVLVTWGDEDTYLERRKKGESDG